MSDKPGTGAVPERAASGAEAMAPEALALALDTKGFLLEAEGLELFRRAFEASPHGPCLELGSYCGRSTVFLAQGCRQAGGHPLFCVDHHRGSEEQQPGEEYYDPELFDPEHGVVDTLRLFRGTLHRADLGDWAIPLVAEASMLSRYWTGGSPGGGQTGGSPGGGQTGGSPGGGQMGGFQLVFIDGSHDQASVDADYDNWGTRVFPGGFLMVHDVFTDPADGGLAPHNTLTRALATGLWDTLEQVESLAVLRRRAREP